MKVELVTTLKRKATEIISELQDNREPLMITQHGRPAAVLVDVESYEAMTRRISVLEGIALGERAVRDGKVLSQPEVEKRLRKWAK